MAAVSTVSFTNHPVFDAAPSGVQQFVLTKGLLPALSKFLSLAEEIFDVAAAISLSEEEDPDTGEHWIEVNICARGSVDDVMKSHDQFIERSLATPLASPHYLRPFLHIAEN